MRPIIACARTSALVLLALIACTDVTGPDNAGGDIVPAGRYSAAVSLGSRVIYLGAAKSEPVNYIRSIVYDKATGEILGRLDQSLDPSKTEFELSFKVTLPTPGFTNTGLTMELANRTGSSEVVQYSGRALDVRLQPSDIRQVDIDIYPGPLENLDVAGVVIAEPIPDRLERDSVRATATLQGAATGARPVWSSLDAGIAKIDPSTGMITGVLPGSARIVAAVGTHADTAGVKVLQRRDRVIVTPTVSSIPEIGDTLSLAAKVVDPRGAEMAGETVTWSVTDTTIGHFSSPGKFVSRSPGTTQVWATSASEQTLKGNAAVTVTYIPPDASKTTITAAPDTIVANGAATSAVTVQLKDAAGNNVTAGGKQVTASISGGGTLSALTNNGTGRYTAVLTAPTKVGAGTIAGSVGGALIPSTRKVVYVAGAPNRYIVTTTTMNTAAGSTITITAQLVDAFDNAVPGAGRTVVWGSVGGGSFSPAASVTDANGLATVSFTTGTVAGATYTITATDGQAGNVGGTVGPIATTPATVSFSASTVTASAASIGANGTSQSVITIRLKDANGNNLTSSAGSITVTKSGGGTLGSVVDNGDGTYTVTLTAPTSTGSATISALLNGAPLTSTATVAFVAGAASLEKSTLLASPSTIIANGFSSSVVTIQLKDALGNNLTASGGVVTAGRTGTGALSAVTDNGNGTYTATLTSPILVGSAVVSAAMGGAPLTLTAHVSYVSGPATRYIVTASSSSVTGGSTVTVTAKLVDANGNPVHLQGRVITWGSTGSGGAFAPAISSTNENGEAVVVFTTSTNAGTVHTVSATDAASPPVTGTSGNITTSAGTASLSRSTVVAVPNALDANGTAVSAVTVQLKDENGNNLTSSAGTIALMKVGGGTLSAVTDQGNGSYTATLTAPVTVGSAVITATLGGSALTNSGTVQFVAGSASLSQSTVAASPSSIVANGTSTSTITIRLKDASGNNLTGSAGTVTVSRVGGGTMGTVTDNNDGTYSATLTSATTAGSAVVSASLGGNQLGNTATVTFTVGAASLALSTVEASPASVTANGTSLSTVTIRLRDAGGNSLTGSGGTVTITKSGVGTISAVTDNGDGTYTATISSTATGSSVLTAKLIGADLTHASNPATVTFIPGLASFATSTVTSAPTSVIADNVSVATITVRLKDANGNSLTASGGTVTVALTGVGTVSSVVDNNDGTYSATVKSAVAGTATVTAKLGGSNLTSDGNPVAVTFVPGTASLAHSTVSANPSTVTADNTAVSTITVRLKDASGNNLTASGGTVTVTGTGVGTISAVTDNNDGTYTATTKSSVAGTGVITAKLAGSAFTHASNPVTVTFATGAASLANSTISRSPTSVVADNTTVSTITIQLKDAGSNNLTASGGTVTLTGTGVGTLSAVADNNNGTYTATIKSAVTGTATVTAKLGGVSLTNASNPVAITFVPGTASLAHSTVTASPTTVSADNVAVSTITVRLKDANDNNLTASGGAVTVTGTGVGTISAVTDNNDGTYTATTKSGVAGTGVITAKLAGSAFTHASNPVTVIFAAGAASLANSTISSTPTSVVADNSAVSTITIQLKDANSNNLTASGGTVTLSRTGVGTLSAVTDNNNGTYTATIKSATSGTGVVTAKLGGADLTHASNPNTVTFVPGAASLAQSTVTANPTSVSAGETSAITVQLKDANGNNLTSSGGTITVLTSLGSLGAVTNNNNGTYSATLTTSAAGSATISAKLDGNDLVSTASVDAVTGSASATTSTLAVNVTSVESGQTATVTVVVKDASGNVITGASSGSFTLATTIGTLGTVSCTGGTCTSTFTGTTAGTASITAKIGGNNIVNSPKSVTVNAGALHHFTVTATDGSALTADRTAGSAFNIRFVAQDAANNTVTGFTGTADITTNSLFSTGTATTTAAFTAGVLASHAVTLTRAGTARTITATKTGSTEAGTSSTFTVGAGALAKMQLLVPGETAAAGTTSGKTGTPTDRTAGSAFNVTVNGVDANWNVVTSTTHSIAITSSDGAATLPANADLVEGTKTFAVTLRTVGTRTVTATNNTNGAITANASPNITVVAGALDNFLLTLADGSALSTANLAASTQFDIRIVARDADNNTVTGFTGTVSISASTAVFGSGSGTTATFSAGVLASHPIVITNGGTFALTATGSGKTGASNITLAANLSDATTSTLAVGSNALASGQNTTVTVTLKQQDGSAFTTGNATHFNLTASSGTLGTQTCNLGVCTSTFTATTSGNAVISAKIGGTNIVNSTQTIAVTAGAPSAVTSTFAVASNALLQNATTTATVVVKDAAGNTVTGATSASFDLATTLGSFGTVNCVNGTCTSTYTASALGTASLTAKIGGTNIVDSPQSIVVAAVPGAPTALAGTPGNTQVSLTWTAPASNGGSAVTNYIVEFKLNSEPTTWTVFAHDPSTTTNIIVTGLTNGSLYNFRVAAVNAIGTGAVSSTVNATPRTVPGAPTNLAGTPGSALVALTWTAPTNNGGSAITDYLVQFSATGANTWSTFNDGVSTTTSATVNSGLTNGTTYDFRVSAINAAGTGAASTLIIATPGAPSAPLSPSASVNQVSNNTHTATLSWSAPSYTGGGITDYQVEYKTAAATSYSILSRTPSSTTTASVTGLADRTTYNFRVAAKANSTVGAYSSVFSGTTTGPSERLSCYTPGSSNSSSATISITPCTGVSLGELIIIPVGVSLNNDNSARTITAPAGFTALSTTANSDFSLTVFYKHAVAADVGRTDPYTFSWTGNVKSIVTLVAYKDITGMPVGAGTTGAGTTASSPAVADPGVAAYSLVYIFAANASMGSTTPNLGQWTLSSELYKNTTAGANNAQAIAIVTGDVDKAGAGATTAKTATTSGMNSGVAWTGIVLRIQP